MGRIDWSDEYKLGLPAIDTDHRELMDLCNEFLDAVEADAPLAALAAILDRMVLRTRAHFLAEERMLDRHSYPGLAIHKAEHDRMLVQAEMLRTRFNEARQEEDLLKVTSDTADFLQFWLLDHIRTKDRPYRPFLRSLA